MWYVALLSSQYQITHVCTIRTIKAGGWSVSPRKPSELAYNLVVQAVLLVGLAKLYMLYAVDMVILSLLCSWATELELYSIGHRGYITLVRESLSIITNV